MRVKPHSRALGNKTFTFTASCFTVTFYSPSSTKHGVALPPGPFVCFADAVLRLVLIGARAGAAMVAAHT